MRSAASPAVALAACLRTEVPRLCSCPLPGSTSWVLLPPAALCPRVTSVTSRPCLARAGDVSVAMPITLPRGPASCSFIVAVGGTPTTSERWRSASRSASNRVRGGAGLGQTRLDWVRLGCPCWDGGRGRVGEWERRAVLPAARQPDPEGLPASLRPGEQQHPTSVQHTASLGLSVWHGGLWVFLLGDSNQLTAQFWELASSLVRTRQ